MYRSAPKIDCTESRAQVEPAGILSSSLKRWVFALWASRCGSEYLTWLICGQCEHRQNVPSEPSDSLLKQQSFPGGGESVVPETRPSHPVPPMTVPSPSGRFCFSVVQVWPDNIGTLWILQRVIPAYLFLAFFPFRFNPFYHTKVPINIAR